MPNAVECEITGGAELEQAMLDTTVKKARSAMRAALEAAGDFMRITMVMAMNFIGGTGFLARHIVTKITLSAKNDAGTLSVGPSKEAYYGTWDEFGSIHNKPPRPFIRPAFETGKEKWLDIFSQKLKDEMGL